MAQGDDICSSFQLIMGNGSFNAIGLEHFCKKVKLSEHGLSYAVVSIIGPQSTGKSTLLNHLYRTNFTEMDDAVGWSLTTRGVWVAKATDIDPCTLIIDVEGSDSSERGEDVTFEKHNALFALAISDVLLINLWCHDIAREHAGSRALLKTVFEMMMRLFSPRKRTLLFVIRDKKKAMPLEPLSIQLRESIQKIYDSVRKPEAHREAKLNNFFDVEVTSLPNYQYEEKAFKEEVVSLRQLILRFTTNGLARDQQDKIHASGISSNAQTVWETIKENKDLNLPEIKIMASSVRCEEILNEKFAEFVQSEDWRTLDDAQQSGPVKHFGKKMTSAINTCLSKYDKEALYYDESVQSVKRQILQEKLLKHVQATYKIILDHLLVELLNGFKENLNNASENGEPLATAAQYWSNHVMSTFDEVCKDAAIEQSTLDSSGVRDHLKTAINKHITLVEARDATSAAQTEPQKRRFSVKEFFTTLLKGLLKRLYSFCTRCPGIGKMLIRLLERLFCFFARDETVVKKWSTVFEILYEVVGCLDGTLVGC